MTTRSKTSSKWERSGAEAIRIPILAGAVCLLWNGLDLHGAFGLGTVNYWTVLGVAWGASFVVTSLGVAFFTGKEWAEWYGKYRHD